MTGANLTEVDFSGADLTAATLAATAMNGINLTEASVDYADLSCARAYYQTGSARTADAAQCPATPATSAPNAAATLKQGTFTQTKLQNAPPKKKTEERREG